MQERMKEAMKEAKKAVDKEFMDVHKVEVSGKEGMFEISVHMDMSSVDPKYYNIALPIVPWAEAHDHFDTKEVDGVDIIHLEHSTLAEIAPDAPTKYRRALEKIAYYIRRENGYSFPPYHVAKPQDDEGNKDAIFFLWIGKDIYTIQSDAKAFMTGSFSRGLRGRVYGACVFRPAPTEDNRDSVASHYLDWIWIHPYARGEGITHEAWSYFEERFGKFGVTTPVTKAMVGFLKKRGWKI